ncbi:hypothetical protein GGTG_12466 [Gaeumannomyces tritici R3-111a-1]|uniref:Uncharacterized protein n=1 Tax=Gaeumannomyces tritici (strain R3-111a-1) TaxID=644352 RepID=J3PG39_GAET3|nr:hypothetical protein GGTG_12466 [Gaeumannomyces tritici R3-111a-1]EJT70293.1 hypothetical protein GGTG_12466 [Gaeumannomyces tritici R3-111a-1]
MQGTKCKRKKCNSRDESDRKNRKPGRTDRGTMEPWRGAFDKPSLPRPRHASDVAGSGRARGFSALGQPSHAGGYTGTQAPTVTASSLSCCRDGPRARIGHPPRADRDGPRTGPAKAQARRWEKNSGIHTTLTAPTSSLGQVPLRRRCLVPEGELAAVGGGGGGGGAMYRISPGAAAVVERRAHWPCAPYRPPPLLLPVPHWRARSLTPLRPRAGVGRDGCNTTSARVSWARWQGRQRTGDAAAGQVGELVPCQRQTGRRGRGREHEQSSQC